MCHGHPHQHACSHTSIKWLYCPEAIFDLDTGYEEHCSNPIYSTIQPTNADCPLQHCYYKAVRGSWNCCKCGQGPNTLGWCTMPVQEAGQNDLTGETQLIGEQCNHGCCKRCTRYRKSFPSKWNYYTLLSGAIKGTDMTDAWLINAQHRLLVAQPQTKHTPSFANTAAANMAALDPLLPRKEVGAA